MILHCKAMFLQALTLPSYLSGKTASALYGIGNISITGTQKSKLRLQNLEPIDSIIVLRPGLVREYN